LGFFLKKKKMVSKENQIIIYTNYNLCMCMFLFVKANFFDKKKVGGGE